MFSYTLPITRKKKLKKSKEEKIISYTKTLSVIVNNNIQNTLASKSFENVEIKILLCSNFDLFSLINILFLFF